MKKKPIRVMILCIMAMVLFNVVPIFAATMPSLLIDGVKNVEKNNTTIRKSAAYVSLRTLGENQGYQVTYDGAKRVLTLTKGKKTVKVTADAGTYYIDDKKVTTKMIPFLENGKMYIHLSDVKTIFNLDTYYHVKNNMITLTTAKMPVTPPVTPPTAPPITPPPTTPKPEENPVNPGKVVEIVDVIYEEVNGFPQLSILADQAIEYTSFSLSAPDRYVIDIPNAIMKTSFSEKEINQFGLKKVRVAQFSPENKVVRVVVDLENPRECKITQPEDKKSIMLVYANIIKPFTYKSTATSDLFTVSAENSMDYVVTELEEPRRLVIDVKSSILENSKQVMESTQGFRYLNKAYTGQFDLGTSRFVFELKEDAYYDVRGVGNTMSVYISNSPFNIIDYKKGYDNAIVTMNPNKVISCFSEYDPVQNMVKVTYQGFLDMEEGTSTINDNLIEYYKMERIGTQSVVSFKLKPKVAYSEIKSADGSVTSFRLKKQAESARDLTIFIDAGHGGKDPGAVAGDGTKEKSLSLEVATLLNEKLKALGFNTIMGRSDDTYVSLQDRALTANSQFADFFMSIHFNSFQSTSKGIETLYYPNVVSDVYDQDNKAIAKIFQQETIKALGLTDRGVKERPGLYVLSKTYMPAILSELGFISNPTELAIIKSNGYTEKAAEALCVSIVRYFEEIKGIKIK